MSVKELHLSHDAFRHGALGKNGYRVLSALRDLGSVSEAEILRSLPGMHASTLRRHLRRLQHHGLAVLSDAGWRPVPGGDLDGIALRLGKAGQGERQQATHRHQRQTYRAYTRSAGARPHGDRPASTTYTVRSGVQPHPRGATDTRERKT